MVDVSDCPAECASTAIYACLRGLRGFGRPIGIKGYTTQRIMSQGGWWSLCAVPIWVVTGLQ